MRPVSAWVMSLIVHCAIFVTLGLTLRFAPRGVALEPDRNVGIVLVHQREGQREYFDGESDQAEQTQAATANLASALPAESEVPVDLTGALPDPSELAGGLGDAIIDATQLTSGGSPRGSIDGGTSTEVFGVTGYGSKFVYVFDRSGSMDGFGGRPLAAAKMELLSSLNDLDRTHQFQIIFYNEEPMMLKSHAGTTPQLVWGDEPGKASAAKFVRSITATGGTRHLAALELALRMQPDAVFFLTDADEPQLTTSELTRIRRWNRHTMVHAIEFGFGPQGDSNNFLVRLARQNGGQHAYVDLSKLRPRL